MYELELGMLSIRDTDQRTTCYALCIAYRLCTDYIGELARFPFGNERVHLCYEQLFLKRCRFYIYLYIGMYIRLI